MKLCFLSSRTEFSSELNRQGKKSLIHFPQIYQNLGAEITKNFQIRIILLFLDKLRGAKTRRAEFSPQLYWNTVLQPQRQELNSTDGTQECSHNAEGRVGFLKAASLVKILLKWLFIQRYYSKYKMSFYNQFSGRHLHSKLFSHQSGYLLKGTILHIKSHFIISFQVGICTSDCLVITGNHFSDA